MTQNTLPPRIKFFQYHRPQMEAGEYTVTVSGSVSHAKISHDNQAGAITQRFAVFGERFQIPATQVRGVFPQANSTGNYESDFPHILLHRNTLPWERHADVTDRDTPWLALLLFDEDEVPEKKIMTAGQLADGSVAGGTFPALPSELGQDSAEKLTVIDVPQTVLQKILPASKDALKLLAHTRQGVDSSGNLVGEENATVFCNRLPEPGRRSTVHLVSLEARYDNSGFKYPAAGAAVRLVSLHSWSFFTIEHFRINSATLSALVGKASATDLEALSTLLDREFAGTEDGYLEQAGHETGLDLKNASYKGDLVAHSRFEKTFDGLLKHLNKDLINLRMPLNADAQVEGYFAKGLVPLEHHFRNGDDSVSWYRGPLVPYEAGAATDGQAVRGMTPEFADELYQWDDSTGMFEVTYATAYELGRLMALANKEFSEALYKWKRLQACAEHCAAQASGHEHLPSFAHGDPTGEADHLWDQTIRPFLDRLAQLQDIPAHYLIPDERMLPKESIRFFHVDKNWLVALINGAFAVGGAWEAAQQVADGPFKSYLDNLLLGQESGFLLRSDVVDGWPGILVEGTADFLFVGTPRRKLLNKDILMLTFETDVNRVVFSQKPEVMHFGLEKDNATFGKRVRNPDGDEVGQPLAITWQGPASDRVINPVALSATLGHTGNPAAFAMNMVEGVPRVIFEVEPITAIE